MYKVDIQNKKLIEIPTASFSALNLKERFDIQEWINGTPTILGEELLIIAKELYLPSGKRLDLLAVDKQGALVVVELKRDDSGSDVEWQAIKYASYCSSFTQDEIYQKFAEYLGSNDDDAQVKIEEFINCELEELNQEQRIILVSKDFNSEVISAVLWLREFEVEIECIRLTPHLDEQGNLFINSEIIIPLPEAKDYIQKKESKQKENKMTGRSSFSLEKSDFPREDLKQKLIETFQRPTELTPRFRAFVEIIIKEDRAYDREEIKQAFLEAGIGKDIGQAGRYLAGIAGFLTKKSTPHLRQIIEFELSRKGKSSMSSESNLRLAIESEDSEFQNSKSFIVCYRVISNYRELVYNALEETAAPENHRDV